MADNKRKTSQTVISEIDRATLHSLRSFVNGAINHLQWRHSGLGMLQAYIVEGGEHELRVHVWHPSLKIDGIDAAGLGHDHRFDMTSWVLAGQLTHVEIESSVDPAGGWKVYEVINARKALQETGSRAGEFRLIHGVVGLKRNAISILAGNSYFFPKGSFHETHLDSALAITVALKTNQNDQRARILCRLEREPLNAFGTSLSESQCKLVLAQAEAVLRDIIHPTESASNPTERQTNSHENFENLLTEASLHRFGGLFDSLCDQGQVPATHKD
jgi:hypothetical protein